MYNKLGSMSNELGSMSAKLESMSDKPMQVRSHAKATCKANQPIDNSLLLEAECLTGTEITRLPL
jgi:hypothetical protein